MKDSYLINKNNNNGIVKKPGNSITPAKSELKSNNIFDKLMLII